MTCKQLHGACDMEFHSETAEEMMEQSKAHGMEMAQKGDESHLKVMGEMRSKMEGMSEEDMMKWQADFKAEFDAVADDE